MYPLTGSLDSLRSARIQVSNGWRSPWFCGQIHLIGGSALRDRGMRVTYNLLSPPSVFVAACPRFTGPTIIYPHPHDGPVVEVGIPSDPAERTLCDIGAGDRVQGHARSSEKVRDRDTRCNMVERFTRASQRCTALHPRCHDTNMFWLATTLAVLPDFETLQIVHFPYRGGQGASDYYGHSGELPKQSRDELGGLKDWAISCLKSETGSQEGERRKRTTLSELRVIELSPDRPLLDSVELNFEVYEIQRFDRKGLQRHVRWDIQRHYEVTRQNQNMVGNVCGWARPNSND